MPEVNPLLVTGGFGLFTVVFWPWALSRALSQIMTNAYFRAERPLAWSEYRRFLLCAILMMAGMALALVIVAPTGQHPHVEYHRPIGILRLILASIVAGLVMGVGSWALLKLQMMRRAKFHHPSLATWKGTRFYGPKKRRMTPEERRAFLQRMNLSDFLEYIFSEIVFFVSLPYFVIAISLVMYAPAEGFIPALSQTTHGLIGAEILLMIAGFAFATVSWPLGRLFVWLGWTRTLV